MSMSLFSEDTIPAVEKDVFNVSSGPLFRVPLASSYPCVHNVGLQPPTSM